MLALVASACSDDGLETPGDALQDTRSDLPDSGYAVGAVPDGLMLCAVSTPSPVSVTPPDASLRLYGQSDLADPYDGVLIGVGRFLIGVEMLDLGVSEPVEVAGAPGFSHGGMGVLGAALDSTDARSVTWDADGSVAQVSVRGDTDLDPVLLAEDVVVDGADAAFGADRVPDGFVELGEVYALEADEEFRFSLDYGSPEAGGDPAQLMILVGRSGTADSMNGVRFRASRSQSVELTVGSPAIYAETDLETGLISRQVNWITEDGLVLRLFSLALSREDMISAAESVELVDGDEWRDLVEEFEADACRPG